MAEIHKTTQEKVLVQKRELSEEFFTVRSTIYTFLNIVEIVLVLRFVFKLLFADAVNSLVQFIYAISFPLIVPFRLTLPAVSAEGMVVEWATLVAMVFYGLFASLLVYLFRLIMERQK